MSEIESGVEYVARRIRSAPSQVDALFAAGRNDLTEGPDGTFFTSSGKVTAAAKRLILMDLIEHPPGAWAWFPTMYGKDPCKTWRANEAGRAVLTAMGLDRVRPVR